MNTVILAGPKGFQHELLRRLEARFRVLGVGSRWRVEAGGTNIWLDPYEDAASEMDTSRRDLLLSGIPDPEMVAVSCSDESVLRQALQILETACDVRMDDDRGLVGPLRVVLERLRAL